MADPIDFTAYSQTPEVQAGWKNQLASDPNSLDIFGTVENYAKTYYANVGPGKPTGQAGADSLFGSVGKVTSDFFGSLNSGLGASPFDMPGLVGTTVQPNPTAQGGTGSFAAPPSTSIFAGPSTLAGSFSAPASGGTIGLGALLSNALTGENPPGLTPSGAPISGGGGTTIAPYTIAPVTNTYSYDQSNRSTSTSTVNYTSQTAVNQADVIKNILDGVKGFFGTVQAAPSSVPFNDATQTRGAIYPGMFSQGQVINSDWSQPSTPSLKVGNLSTNSDAPLTQNRLTVILVALAVVTFFILVFRRKG